MTGKMVNRHKNCGGFILPDINNSFSGMGYGYCPKCGKVKLTLDDYDITEEHIDLFTIINSKTDEFLLVDNDGFTFTVTFESEQQANEFAAMHGITPEEYTVKKSVAIYCDNAPVTNGRMIINGGEK